MPGTDKSRGYYLEVICADFLAMKDLEVHHMKRRSQLGDDMMHNLITLCVSCHGKCHGRRR
jgi:5-methylcytosine-specific restriction endonuclease McrA